jgi:hypothetical protein
MIEVNCPADVPSELIKLANMIDYSQVQSHQIDDWLKELDKLAIKYKNYLPLRTENDKVSWKKVMLDENMPPKVRSYLKKYNYSFIPHSIISLIFPKMKEELAKRVKLK